MEYGMVLLAAAAAVAGAAADLPEAIQQTPEKRRSLCRLSMSSLTTGIMRLSRTPIKMN